MLVVYSMCHNYFSLELNYFENPETVTEAIKSETLTLVNLTQDREVKLKNEISTCILFSQAAYLALMLKF